MHGASIMARSRIILIGAKLLLAVLLLWLTNGAFANAEITDTVLGLGSVAGMIRNQTGQPLADVEVAAVAAWNTYPPILVTTTSNISGSYRIPFLPAGNYYLRFRDTNKLYGTQYYTNSAIADTSVKVQVMGDQQNGLDVMLQPGGVITGLITFQGEPPPLWTALYVTLELFKANHWYSAGNAEVITATGQYTSDALLPGIYRVCANSYNSVNYNYFALCYPNAITVTASLQTPNINLDLAQSNYNGAIGGTVTGDGMPLSGIRVDLFTEFDPAHSIFYTYTDSSGFYSIQGLSGNYYSLVFRDTTNTFASLRYSDTPPLLILFGYYLPLFQNQQIENLDVELPRSATITGSVWKSNGQPLAGIEVIPFWPLWGYDWQYTALKAVTDEDGHYTLSGLLPGKYRLAFRSCSMPDSCELVEFFGDTELGFIDLYSAKDFVLQAGQTISDTNLVFGPDPRLYLPMIQRQ